MKPFISFCLLLCICLGKLYAQGVNIVYIGNSITQGALLKTPVTEAPPVQASQYIEQATKKSERLLLIFFQSQKDNFRM